MCSTCTRADADACTFQETVNLESGAPVKNSKIKRHQQSWSKMLSHISPPLSKQRSLTYSMLYRQKILHRHTYELVAGPFHHPYTRISA